VKSQGSRLRVARFGGQALAAIVLACTASAAPAPSPPPDARAPLDFSGTWKLDTKASVNVSANMKDAVLLVEQKGDKVTVSPAPQGPGKLNIAGEQIVADGRAYEKAVGGGKGIVTARWSADGQALEMEITGGPPENPRQAVQTIRWTLAADRSTWVRETRTVGQGRARQTRLVFHREAPEPARTAPPRKK
jgi:hypothetical protein